MPWAKIPLDKSQLVLAHVLRCGQTFRWHYVDGVWSIGLKNRILMLKQDSEYLYYTQKGQETKETTNLVNDYFNLQIDLKELYNVWTTDLHFNGKLAGIRILRQDPWETLCAFICSSNNNIKRISTMVHALCVNFGKYLGSVGDIKYYDFPEPHVLAEKDVEQKLRDLKFGYRAKYIHETAKKVAAMDDGYGYLLSLRDVPYQEARLALLQFAGVGPKVADCVCLMSLDKHDCVPVDTHIWQIARETYKMPFKSDPAGYKKVQDEFKALWGSYAGWAQSVVFAGDLSDFNTPPRITAKEVKEEVTEATTRVRKRVKKETLTSISKDKAITSISKDKTTTNISKDTITNISKDTITKVNVKTTNSISTSGYRIAKRKA